MDEGVYDLAVIGAGPAGMAAAIEATALGLSVCVLDEQPAPGGQIYRGILNPPPMDRSVLGPDYWEGSDLVRRFLSCGCTYRPGATVWHADDGDLSFATRDGGETIGWRRLLNATGAMERPMPVEGWTLPGVMTAGAAQILLKGSATAADDAVFCGSGPLLYLVAAQYLRAGVKIAAVLDTTPRWARLRTAHRLPAALAGWTYLVKGIGLLREISAAGARVVSHVERIELRGEGRLERVVWHSSDAQGEIAADHAFLHQGIAPNVNLGRALGYDHVWDDMQLSLRPRTDTWGATSRKHIYAAGDVSGIGGARAAALRGRLAAMAIAAELGRRTIAERDSASAPLRSTLRRELAVRPFLDSLFRPSLGMRVPPGDHAIVCRCEEVTAGQIRQALTIGASGPNQLKAFTRCGMGPCQGRSCGLTATALTAQALGIDEAAAGYFNIRFPVKPVMLRDVAGSGPRN